MPHPKFTLGSKSKRVYNSGIHRDLQQIIDFALESVPIDFSLTSGKRTAKEQFELFKVGRRFTGVGSESNPNSWDETGGGVITHMDGTVKKSRHQSGKAFDFMAYIPGRPDLSYDKIHMAVLIGSFLTIADILNRQGIITHGLRSGADWDSDTQFLEPGTFVDMPHLELIDP